MDLQPSDQSDQPTLPRARSQWLTPWTNWRWAHSALLLARPRCTEEKRVGWRIAAPYQQDMLLYRLFLSMSSLIIVLTSFMKSALKVGESKGEVGFSNEELCICFSDITVNNFLITKTGPIYVIDFEEAVFLPTSFMCLVLRGRRQPSCSENNRIRCLSQS